MYLKHSLIESILFSTNEIELTEAIDLQVIHESGEGPYWRLGGQAPLLGAHQVPGVTAPPPGLDVKKDLVFRRHEWRALVLHVRPQKRLSSGPYGLREQRWDYIYNPKGHIPISSHAFPPHWCTSHLSAPHGFGDQRIESRHLSRLLRWYNRVFSRRKFIFGQTPTSLQPSAGSRP